MNKYFCGMQATRLMIDNEITGTTSFDELWTRKYLYRYWLELVFTRLSAAINNRNVFLFIFQVSGK